MCGRFGVDRWMRGWGSYLRGGGGGGLRIEDWCFVFCVMCYELCVMC